MTTLEARETQCTHIRLDGKRCRVKTNEEEYLCEHHAYDFYYFMRNPIKVAKQYRRYWGKAHHPACDKKGTLLCGCPNISDGAILFQALRRACKTSTRNTKVQKSITHMEMLEKTRKIRAYYRSINAEDIVLPPQSNRRQFRIFTYDRRAKRVVVKKIKDCIRNSEVLLKHLRRHAPIAVYYSTSTWLNPQNIGPDPFSKSGRRKFRKQGLLTHYHNTWLGQAFYIDVDYEMKDSRMAAEMTEKVIEWYKQNVNFKTKHGKVTASSVRQNISRNWKKSIIGSMKRDGLLVDFEVTPDPRRIIRVPGTVHGKKMTVCEVISEDTIYDGAKTIE